ncbi:MAG: alpha/beta hydrolase, partial [Verrucomicrobiota bacterium]
REAIQIAEPEARTPRSRRQSYHAWSPVTFDPRKYEFDHSTEVEPAQAILLCSPAATSCRATSNPYRNQYSSWIENRPEKCLPTVNTSMPMKHDSPVFRSPLSHSLSLLLSARFLLFVAVLGGAGFFVVQAQGQAGSITVLHSSGGSAENPSYGLGIVAVSEDHEADESVAPGASITLTGDETIDATKFFSTIGDTERLLLFVSAPGKTVSESLRWAAKITSELDAGDVVLVFTTPGSDSGEAEKRLAALFGTLQANTGVAQIDIVAHGDGSLIFNRALAAALQDGFDLAVSGEQIDYGAEAAEKVPVVAGATKTDSGVPQFTTRGIGGTTRSIAAPQATVTSPPAPEEADEESKEYHTIDVFYGTDRKPTVNTGENDRYGPERHREGPMEYGRTTISIPLHHKIGVVERPRWYKLEFSEDPKKHVTIQKLEKMAASDFFSEVGDTAGQKPKNEALLFVHGFNVPFDDAVRRTGQIAFDLDFAGVALTFSWPSQGSLKAYTIDEANAEWAVPHLTQFLMDLQEKTEIEKIHVIAHSMGTRVLSYALANARDEGFDLDLQNVILAAPDIDVDVFKDQILPKITEASDTLTMYASSDDTALKVSQTIHGVARLGLSGDSILVAPGMDTVNASGIDTSMLGHGYYGSHKVVVTDIFNLVIKGLEPPRRKLIPGSLGEWDFDGFGEEE